MEYRLLGSLVKRKIGYGIVQPGQSTGNGVPIIKVNNIISGLESINDLDTTSHEISEKYSRTILRGGELIVSVVGTIGKTAIVPENFAGCNLVRAVALLDIEDKIISKWVKYYLDSPYGKDYISQNLNTTVQPTLNIKSLTNMPIPFYDTEYMEKTIDLLSEIDDKIALNNKINDNLEQQTQALYQKYFPETDNAGKLADLCDFSKDKIAVSELNVKNYFSTENMLPDKKGTTEAANLPAVEQTTACHIGNVLVSNIRPYFKKILYCHCEGGCSTDVLCFVPKILELSAYLYCTLYADKFFDFMVAGSKGTKMPRGDKKQIMTYSVCLPSENELKNFNAAVLPMFQLIESNRRENARLSLLRDTLLPKLMAGEI